MMMPLGNFEPPPRFMLAFIILGIICSPLLLPLAAILNARDDRRTRRAIAAQSPEDQ